MVGGSHIYRKGNVYIPIGTFSTESNTAVICTAWNAKPATIKADTWYTKFYFTEYAEQAAVYFTTIECDPPG